MDLYFYVIRVFDHSSELLWMVLVNTDEFFRMLNGKSMGSGTAKTSKVLEWCSPPLIQSRTRKLPALTAI